MELLKRSNSVCIDPKDELLNAVKANKQSEIKHIVKNNPGILRERYAGTFLKPILYIALKDLADNVNENTINFLIEKGAPLNYIDSCWNSYEAIHFATLGQKPSILKCIIQHYDKNYMDISTQSDTSNTALHVLIKEGDSEKSGFEECARILLDYGIDYNITDDKNAPPIYWAAKKKYTNIVTLLLSYPNLDLDSYSFRNKTARDIIKELGINELPQNYTNEINNNNMLLNYIKQGKEEDFISVANQMEHIEDDKSEKSFMQYACDKYLVELTKYLISRGADINRVSKKFPMSPVEMAAQRGYHVILKILIDQPGTRVSNDVLLYILPKLDFNVTDRIDYQKCFDVLISSQKSINYNHKDKNRNFPLHYAVRYGGPDIVLKLLNKKASLANRNAFDYLNISEIDYITLKKHFDNCIDGDPRNQFDKEDMEITYDYETILPAKTDLAAIHELDEETNICKKKTYPTPETDAVLFMSKSSELKSLLKHPLITSFLYVKWYRIRGIFYINLIFYLTFLASLLLYIFVYYKESIDQQNAFVYVFLLITTGLLFVREVFQIAVGPRKYFSNFENFIEISLIIIVGFMLFGSDTSLDIKTQAAAVSFLLAASELLFLAGKYPGLSTNIVMLRTVSLNFFKFLLFYSILIVAFAFCFHTLFKHDEVTSVTHNATDIKMNGIEENDKFFSNPVISIFKTIIMLTGEFEAGQLRFEHYPVTSHLIFLAFVMTIAIILLNLLNGLAVSDTQEIRNEAELLGHIARVEYIAYAESMLFSSIIPRKISSWYYNIFPCQNGNKFNRLLLKPLAQRISIYPKYLSGFKLVTYPNQNGRVLIEDGRNESCKCLHIYLDKVTVRRSRALLQEKKYRERDDRERNKLNDIQVQILQKVNELFASIKQ